MTAALAVVLAPVDVAGVDLNVMHHLWGTAIAAGAVLGAVIALVNSWRP